MSKLKDQQEEEIKEGQWKTFIKDSDYFNQRLGFFYDVIYEKILDVKKEENQSVSDFHRILDQKAKSYKGVRIRISKPSFPLL